MNAKGFKRRVRYKDKNKKSSYSQYLKDYKQYQILYGEYLENYKKYQQIKFNNEVHQGNIKQKGMLL